MDRRLSLALLGALALSCADAGDEGGVVIPPDWPDVDYARGGIELTSVVVNQGVEIPLWEDGEPVASDERLSPVIDGRPGFFRAYVDVPDDWEPRDITARLYLREADGEQQVVSQTIFVENDSNPAWYAGSFGWLVPAELITSAAEWELVLTEADDTWADEPLTAPVPYVPPQATDFAAGHRVLDITIVPFDHQYEDATKECTGPVVFDEQRIDLWRNHLMGFNPVEEVRFTVREPVVWTEPMDQFGLMLQYLSELREEDGAPPWRYYFGALDPCDGGSESNWAGLAYRPTETTQAQAYRRVALGEVFVSGMNTMETFVHEVGHNQERQHVVCAGNEGNPDPDYPEEDGVVGTHGFDVTDWVIHQPTEAEFMTYCGPTWIGHYGWNFVLPIVETLSAWELDGDIPDEGNQVLSGVITPSGATRFALLAGDESVERAIDAIEWTGPDGEVHVSPATRQMLDDGTMHVAAPVPGDAQVVAARWLGAQGERIELNLVGDER